MKIDSSKSLSGKFPAIAFTLIELLVVIAIIGILAAMLMPVLSVAQQHARKTTAKLEINQLASAIEEYESEYSRFPVPTAVQQSGSNDVTFGGVYTNSSGSPGGVWPNPLPQPGYYPSNSDVIAILMNFTNYPGGGPTANANYQKNPQQHTFLSAKMTTDASSPGVGNDLNYRDPWGNLYIITMDLNEDNKAEDAFYEDASISSSTGLAGGTGLNGLIWQPADQAYAFHGNVMVWSMGPDGPFGHAPSTFTYQNTPNGSIGWAADPSNKNHILSWQ
jgi:prepilin-type N-terminal cleavage/methylation domain-containing protein